MRDQRPHEGHFLARVVEDDGRVVALAAQAVRRHHHRQIIDVHLVHANVLFGSKYLTRTDIHDVTHTHALTSDGERIWPF